MCRAPTVLIADRCECPRSIYMSPHHLMKHLFFLANVDWALINFMEDWFPEEAHVKLKQNEREATEEHLVEMGFDPNQKCVIM